MKILTIAIIKKVLERHEGFSLTPKRIKLILEDLYKEAEDV